MDRNEIRIFRYFTIVSFVCIMLIGCNQSSQADGQPDANRGQGQVSVHSPANTPTTPVESKATAEQWASAVSQVFDKVNVNRLRDKKSPAYIKDEGQSDNNGVTEFFACFDKAPPKCELSASGKRDSFRKIQFFTDPRMEFQELGAMYARGGGRPSIRAYVSLQDCQQPTILLQPTFRASNWVFLEQFGLMLDGTLVIEHKFDFSQIDRANSHNEVSESAHVVLSESEVNALRRIAQAKQVLIRLTGQKGFVGIDQEGTRNFVEGVARLLRVHDALRQAVGTLGQVKDAACPS